ncbi:MAG TPA: AI-2E family transporter [Azospirillaceae bacterium]|nr:AI-2E family transporter [Azospirillaceae bacterium]
MPTDAGPVQTGSAQAGPPTPRPSGNGASGNGAGGSPAGRTPVGSTYLGGSPSPLATLTGLAAAAVIVVTLYFGRSILTSLALGLLLSFALTPLAGRLRRWGLGKVLSAVIAVTLATTVIAGIGSVLAYQLIDLAGNLPAYEGNIRQKIRTIREASPGGGILERTTEVIRDLGREISEPGQQTGQPPPPGVAEAEREPLPVQVMPPAASPVQVLRDIGGPLIGPIGNASIVFVFVVFILLQREDLRDRVIRLAGVNDMKRTTEALNDAAYRVSRFLLVQLLYNMGYGVAAGLGLMLIGVPNAVLWGLLAAVLRFIPYLGPAVAVTFPTLLSIAVDPGWTMPLMTIGLFVVLELVSNNVVEPLIYGGSTGLSAFAVVLAAIFWTSLWGPVGLLLSMPLTVCLVVLGRHIPQLEFLDVLLGNTPVLSPETRIYQRLLARAPDDAALIADEASKDHPVIEVYETQLLAALRIAEGDRTRGALDDDTLRSMLEGINYVVDYFADAEPEENTPQVKAPGRILCIAGRTDLDEAAATLLADLLNRGGWTAIVLPCEVVNTRAIQSLSREDVRAVVMSYVNPRSERHAQRITRRLHMHFGAGAPVVVGLWGAGTPDIPMPAAIPGAMAVVGSLAEATAAVATLVPLPDAPPSEDTEPGAPATDEPSAQAADRTLGQAADAMRTADQGAAHPRPEPAGTGTAPPNGRPNLPPGI